MSDETLQVVQTTPEPSKPTAEVKQDVAEGGDTAQDEAKKVDAKPEGEEAPKELTEVEKIRQATQKRIDRLTAASKAKDERLAAAERELQELKAKAPKADDGPKESDYDSWEDFHKAVVEHKANKLASERIAAEKEKEVKALQEQKTAESRKQFMEKAQAFATDNPDFDEVAKQATQIMNEMGQAGANVGMLEGMILGFENPAEMLYHVGKEGLVEELMTMPPMSAMRELVKMEIALQGAAKKEAPQAPEPIKSTGGKGGSKSLHERSGKEIMDWLKPKRN